MGLFSRKKTPEQIEKKRLKNFEKEKRKFEKLLEKSRSETPNGPRILYSFDTLELAGLAKTKEEHIICCRLYKEWFEFALKMFNFDSSQLSFTQKLKTSTTGYTTTDEWERFHRSTVEAIYAITVGRDFESVYRLVKEFFGVREKVQSLKIRADFADTNLTYNTGLVFDEVAYYAGFAAYQLGNYRDALRIFNSFTSTQAIPKRHKQGYANELFDRFSFRISSKGMIRKIMARAGDLENVDLRPGKINSDVIDYTTYRLKKDTIDIDFD